MLRQGCAVVGMLVLFVQRGWGKFVVGAIAELANRTLMHWCTRRSCRRKGEEPHGPPMLVMSTCRGRTEEHTHTSGVEKRTFLYELAVPASAAVSYAPLHV